MKKKTEEKMLKEYDFSAGIRGKYAARYAAGSNVIVLSPDVANLFPTSQAVNRALRTFAKMTKDRTKKAA